MKHIIIIIIIKTWVREIISTTNAAAAARKTTAVTAEATIHNRSQNEGKTHVILPNGCKTLMRSVSLVPSATARQ